MPCFHERCTNKLIDFIEDESSIIIIGMFLVGFSLSLYFGMQTLVSAILTSLWCLSSVSLMLMTLSLDTVSDDEGEDVEDVPDLVFLELLLAQ